MRGLSNVTRTDDAQIQVLGPSSTLVRSDVSLGPLTMELKLTLSRRRGFLRFGMINNKNKTDFTVVHE